MDHLLSEALLQRMETQAGALIEVCVTSASYDQWAATFDALVTTEGFTAVVKSGGVIIPSVMTIDMFADNDDKDFSMSIACGRQLWTTHFYSAALIDFQGDPRDVLEDSDIEDVRRFMQVIADSVKRTVRLVPETFEYETETSYMMVEPR